MRNERGDKNCTNTTCKFCSGETVEAAVQKSARNGRGRQKKSPTSQYDTSSFCNGNKYSKEDNLKSVKLLALS